VIAVQPVPDVSVVVPVFNSRLTLTKVFAGIHAVMRELGLEFEVVFVDDASTDGSWDCIRELKAQYEDCVRGFQLGRNSGQQAATYCGLLQSRGEWVVTIDDDLQPHPTEIRKLWEHSQRHEVDIVYGIYSTLRHDWAHRVGTRLFWILMRRVAPTYPNGSSFRLIRGELVRKLPRDPRPSILVDPTLAWHSSLTDTVMVEHCPREHGRSGYSLPAFVSMAYTLLVTYSTVPLRLLTAIGFLSASISIALGVYYLLMKFFVGAQTGFSALIVTITFSSGLILICLGILGEYIARIHTMTTGQPAFTIKSTI
jgi:polyisoprenyl-phosphate glycosyltransferase